MIEEIKNERWQKAKKRGDRTSKLPIKAEQLWNNIIYKIKFIQIIINTQNNYKHSK